MKWRTNGALGKPVPEKRKTAMFAEWLNKAVCSGAGNGTRTHDLRITNALLYQLSYTGTQEMRLYRKRLFCAIRCRREVYSENSRKLTSEVVAHMKPSWKERLGSENASRLRTLHQYSKNVLGYLTWSAAREAAPGVNSFTIQNSG